MFVLKKALLRSNVYFLFLAIILHEQILNFMVYILFDLLNTILIMLDVGLIQISIITKIVIISKAIFFYKFRLFKIKINILIHVFSFSSFQPLFVH